MNNISTLELDESRDRFNIESLQSGSEDAVLLWAKQAQIFDNLSRFWKPRLDIAKKCMNYMRRDIFSRGQRMKYMNVQDKWPIEPQEMRPVIDTLVGQIKESIKPYSVTTEDGNPPPNVAKAEDVNVVLKWWQNKLELNRKQIAALRTGLINGYPQVLLFEKQNLFEGSAGELAAYIMPWESCLFSPDFIDCDGGDNQQLMIVQQRRKAEWLQIYPHREDALRKHLDAIREDPGQWLNTEHFAQGKYDASSRANWIFDMVTASSLEDDNGLYTVVYHLYPVKQKREIWLDESTGDAQEIPEDWNPWERQMWHAQHPEYAMRHTDILPTLWVTAWGSNGFIWDNAPHWFQERALDDPRKLILPAAIFVPDMIDKVPTGAGEDLLPIILMKAVCKTEGLSEVRKGTGTINIYTEGSVRHPARITHELSQEQGVITLKKGYRPDEAFKTIQRKPNTTFYDLDAKLSEELLATHRVAPALQGAFAPRQSAVAKQTEMNAAMTPQSQYIDNYSAFCRNCAQVLCHMIPYFITEQKLVRIDDEYGRPQQALVNQTQYNPATGEAQIIAHDITSIRWRLVMVPGDDSPTARVRDMTMFVQLLEAFGNSLLKLDPVFTANFLASLPNRIAKEAGQYMLANAQQMRQMQMAESQTEMALKQKQLDYKREVELAKVYLPRLMMKTDAGDIQEAPQGFQVFVQYLEALQRKAQTLSPAPQAAGAPTAPQAQMPAAA